MSKKIYAQLEDETEAINAIKSAIDFAGSQGKLGILCSVTQQTVSEWALGKTRPSPRRAVKIEGVTEGLVNRKQVLPDFPW